MEPCKINDPTPRLTHRGLKGKEISSPSSQGRKMSLISPLIDRDFATASRGERVLRTFNLVGMTKK